MFNQPKDADAGVSLFGTLTLQFLMVVEGTRTNRLRDSSLPELVIYHFEGNWDNRLGSKVACFEVLMRLKTTNNTICMQGTGTEEPFVFANSYNP